MSLLRRISFILLLAFLNASAEILKVSAGKSDASNLVQISCAHAQYRSLCLRTLSAYASTAKTPSTLAQAAVSVALGRARSATKFLSNAVKTRSSSKREKAALKDCVEQLTDSVDELRESLDELKSLRPGTFRWQMSNVETWVSAALTNEDTCVDGFQDVGRNAKMTVRKKIRTVARVTSNALYLIDRLAATRP
ncbi:pectinesterase inhibitor 3-like [Aristolochia californica]|uniref:pectinesterase inhibitor 3-like n=1 Tax=Aristolochia californica TaxID=171875 RepID=UPI0035E14B2B